MKVGEPIGSPGAAFPIPQVETVDVLDSWKAWGIACCLFLVLLIVFGIGFDTFVLFYAPLIKQFNWHRTDLGILTLALCYSQIPSNIVAGWLLGRMRAWIMMVAGTVTIILGFALASISNSYALLLCAYTLMGVGLSFSTTLPATVITSKWFANRRGLALGFVTAGTAAGGLTMVNLGGHWLVSYGWRTTYQLFAVIMLLAIPLIIATAREPKIAAASPERQKGDKVSENTEEGVEIREGLFSRAFLLPTLAILLDMIALALPYSYVIPYLIELGYQPERAAMAMSFCHLSAFLGCFMLGWLGDKLGAKFASALSFILLGTGCSALFGAHHLVWIIAFISIFGSNMAGMVSLIALMLSQGLGLKNLGFFLGIIGGVTMIGFGIGPVLGGKIYDLAGTYNSAFALAIMFAALAAVSIAFVPPPRFKGRRGLH